MTHESHRMLDLYVSIRSILQLNVNWNPILRAHYQSSQYSCNYLCYVNTRQNNRKVTVLQKTANHR